MGEDFKNVTPEPKLLVQGWKHGYARIMLIGAGTGVAQALDVIHKLDSPPGASYSVVGIVDKDPALKGKQIWGIEVLGSPDDLLRKMKATDWYDAALITIGSPGPRSVYQGLLREWGIPLITMADPSTIFCMGVGMGHGNLVSARCHFGPEARIGHNNKFSAYCSIEHHSVVGDDNTFGPGVITSGCVNIGSRCKFGTGVFIEPRVTIGDDCVIGSGAIITGNIPPRHIVRSKMYEPTPLPTPKEVEKIVGGDIGGQTQ